MAIRFSLPALPLWLVLVNFWSNIANANLTVRPTDTVVQVNHMTYFNCSTSARNISAKFVIWYHYPVNSPTRKDVYDEGNIMYEYKDRFEIEIDLTEGVFNLVVKRPSLADAGRYECGDGRGHGDAALAELIILDGNPSCDSNMSSDGVIGPNDCDLEPDDIQLTCNVASYRGNIPPSLEWKMAGDERSSSLVVCNRSNSCNLTLERNLTFSSHVLLCQTMKAGRQQYGCSIGPAKVKYALSSNVKLATERDVKCNANSSQPCSYKWYNAKNETVSSDENLVKQKPGNYTCRAQCEMNRQHESCRFIAMEVEVVSPAPLSTALVAFLSILIILCIAMFLTVIGYLYKKDKCPHVFKKRDDVCKFPKEEEELMEKSTHSAVSSQVEDELSSLLIITDEDMVDKLTINDFFLDRGTSGAIYGPFRWENKKCALKQILFNPDQVTIQMKEDIHTKANLYKELKHPHLVKVFDVWFPSPALYILMEYAEGKSLDKILRPKDATTPLTPFPLDIVQDWAWQIADGMKYLHYSDLVHRNLMAAHVLVMEKSDVSPNILKIGSYTPIKQHDHATVMSLKGTMAWMAPELIRGEPFEKSSDVWSYGITVWEILTRDVPFREIRKETDLVRAAINKKLELKIPDLCPEPLQKLLTGCWNNEVDKRTSFTKICDDLRAPTKVASVLREPTANSMSTTRSATELLPSQE